MRRLQLWQEYVLADLSPTARARTVQRRPVNPSPDRSRWCSVPWLRRVVVRRLVDNCTAAQRHKLVGEPFRSTADVYSLFRWAPRPTHLPAGDERRIFHRHVKHSTFHTAWPACPRACDPADSAAHAIRLSGTGEWLSWTKSTAAHRLKNTFAAEVSKKKSRLYHQTRKGSKISTRQEYLF